MIKIIKDGQKEFTTKCDTCGCEFSYQMCDIGLGSVVCPCCGGYVAHRINGPEEPSFSTTFPYKITPSSTADWNALASSDNASRFDSLQLIHDLCIDYDGFSTVEGLKSLIDEIREISKESISELKGNAKKGCITVCDETDCEGCLTKYAEDVSICKARGKQKDKNKLFLDLVRKHPDYPIIPLVDSDVVPDYGDGIFFGEFGFSYIGEFLDYGEKCYQDRDDFIDDWMDAHSDDETYAKLSNSQFDALANKICNEQKWKNVIYVHINTFE